MIWACDCYLGKYIIPFQLDHNVQKYSTFTESKVVDFVCLLLLSLPKQKSPNLEI